MTPIPICHQMTALININKFDISDYSFIEFVEDYDEKSLLIGKIGDEYDQESEWYAYQDPLILIKLESMTVKLISFENLYDTIKNFTQEVMITSVQLSDREPFSENFIQDKIDSKFDPDNETYIDPVPYEWRMKSLLWGLLFGNEYDMNKSINKVILNWGSYNFCTDEFELKMDVLNDWAEDMSIDHYCDFVNINISELFIRNWNIHLKDRNEHEYNLIWDTSSEYEVVSFNKTIEQLVQNNSVEEMEIKEEVKEEALESRSGIFKTRTIQNKKKVARRKRNAWRRNPI